MSKKIDNQIENNYPSEILSAKISNDVFLKSEIKKATNIPSKSVLFNIDQKAAIISKQEIDALLTVFQSVLDQTCGYFSEGYIAKFERDLDKKGVFQDFKEEFKSWRRIFFNVLVQLLIGILRKSPRTSRPRLTSPLSTGDSPALALVRARSALLDVTGLCFRGR